MADEDRPGERTESPTARRRQEARDEGRIARSADVSAAAVILAGAATLASAGGAALAAFTVKQLRESMRALATGPLTTAGGVAAVQGVVVGLVFALLPLLAGVFAIVVLANLMQTRGALTWKPLTPQWSHLNPTSGLKRIVGTEAVVQLVKSVLKLVTLGVITWFVIAGRWNELRSLTTAGPAEILTVVRALVLQLVFVAGIAFMTLALADYTFQWFKHEKSMRMTREEVVREHRETEGDPMVKSRMQSLARSRARSRMLQQVPRADVVVVNPTHIAVALKYDVSVAAAPVVVAMGQRKLAERIKALAIKSNVPIIENRTVARALLASAVVGKAIPPALYTAIAEILAYVYRMRGGLPGANLPTSRSA